MVSSSSKGKEKAQPSSSRNGQWGKPSTQGASSQRGSGLAFDPDMDISEVRQIRSEYRDVISTQADTRANLSNVKVGELISNIQQTNQMFGGVRRAQEATLDSKAISNIAEMAALKTRNLKHSAGGFDVEDFIAKLASFMGGSDPNAARGVDDDEDDMDDRGGVLNWERFGRMALKHSRRVTGVNFMLGPLGIEAKQRAQTKRQSQKVHKDPKQNVAPEDVDLNQEEKNYETDTAFMVSQLQKLLMAKANPDEGGINYFRFVINPTSFEQSVENIFYFAFLVKEGRAALDIADNGEPMIFACDPPSEEDYKGDLIKRQIIAEFDMETWERAIEVFDIRKPIIPTRKPVPPEEKYPRFTGNSRGGRAPEREDEEDEEEEVELPQGDDGEEDDDE
ncbi:Nse4-domain-containing protein [Clavulina sp. PMI_390]|nr:Nse4-domain-containing protein [Clavulina sp. PMI_390]